MGRWGFGGGGGAAHPPAQPTRRRSPRGNCSLASAVGPDSSNRPRAMRFRTASSLVHLVAISAAAAQAPASRGALATGTYAITDVAVVPMTSDTVIRDATVIVRDGRIAEVGPSRGVRVPADVRRVDGAREVPHPRSRRHAHPPLLGRRGPRLGGALRAGRHGGERRHHHAAHDRHAGAPRAPPATSPSAGCSVPSSGWPARSSPARK